MIPDEKPTPFRWVLSSTSTLGYPGLIDYPVKITDANDVTIAFSGEQQLGPSVSSISGSIDRVTGDVEATSALTDPKTNKFISQTTYTLQCRPTQRMF